MVIETQRCRRYANCSGGVLTAQLLLPANPGDMRAIVPQQIMPALCMHVIVIVGTAGAQFLQRQRQMTGKKL